MDIKILGVCGSPIKGGNTEVFLKEALKAAEETGGVNMEVITLAGKEVNDCRHCNWCLAKQEEGKFCAISDDMVELYPKVLEADALLLATPVYLTRLSGYLANFLDRFRALLLGKHYQGVLRHKVGGAVAVSWHRNEGGEMALLSIISAFFLSDMIVVSPGNGFCQYGALGLSSEGGTGKFDPKDKLGVLRDEFGLQGARVLGQRMAEITKTLKAGEQALKLNRG